MDIRLKRAYASAEAGDGCRILVDRVWPRGVSRDEIQIDLWLKDIAPSTELRKWFAHDVDRWEDFQTRYRKEISESEDALEELRERVKAGRVTLVFGAKDETHNQAVVLRDFLQED